MTWQEIDKAISEGRIVSVDEVYNELVRHYPPSDSNSAWVEDRKHIFKNPTNEESITIKLIFQNKKMMESIKKKNILENKPAADVYLVAKAKSLGGCVVTAETYSPNSSKIPNMCELVEVDCINYDQFMEQFAE